VIPTAESPAFDPKIFRFDRSSGDLKLVATLALGYGGLDFTLVDFASQHLVLGWPSVTPQNLWIVNMQAVESPVILPLEFSAVPDSSWRPLPRALVAALPDITKPGDHVIYGDHFIVDGPGGERRVALNVTTFRGRITAGFGLNKHPRVEVLDAADLAGLRIQGDFGLADSLGSTDVLEAHVADGKVIVAGIDIGVPAPIRVAPDVHWRVVGHDGSTTAMYVAMPRVQPIPKGPFQELKIPPQSEVRQSDAASSSTENCTSTLYLRNASSKAWKSVQVPGREPRIKMIDSWLIGAAVCEGFGRESPGAAERRRYEQNYPSNRRREVRSTLGNQYDYYPGVLFLIDAASGRYSEIRTGQGDSEILLVREQTIYYRVNDAIFAAPIEGQSIGAPILLVRHDAIPDVHWAFWGKSSERTTQ
jgi:hypothetical protein